ncbi:MAG: hypothetical protein HY226_01485 [Candidatus Vogelbacteria bacterium]|nr:hypothetical protein [Candidatus Vogelbacteria bacterium]
MTTKTIYLAQTLLEIGAIKFGAFKLKAHETDPKLPLSPIYIDLRIIRSHPDVLRFAVQCMIEKIKQEKLRYDLIADLPTAGTPIATLVMDRTNIPMVTPKKEIKTHGIAAKVEGVYKAGSRVLMIDDLATKADTKIEAAKTLREAGLNVTDAVVIIDRKQGAGRYLAPHGIRMHSILNLPEMLSYYQTSKLIPSEKFREVQRYLSLNLLSLLILAPHVWGIFFRS